MKKRVIIIALLLVGVSTQPLMAQEASIMETNWDYVGESYFTSTSVTVKSDGGYFKACGHPDSEFYGIIELFEHDPIGPQKTGTNLKYIEPGTCAIWSDLDNLVDGSNNKAEFFVKKHDQSNTKTAHVLFYD